MLYLFELLSGILQGCTMGGFLFAVSFDPLLGYVLIVCCLRSYCFFVCRLCSYCLFCFASSLSLSLLLVGGGCGWQKRPATKRFGSGSNLGSTCRSGPVAAQSTCGSSVRCRADDGPLGPCQGGRGMARDGRLGLLG